MSLIHTYGESGSFLAVLQDGLLRPPSYRTVYKRHCEARSNLIPVPRAHIIMTTIFSIDRDADTE